MLAVTLEAHNLLEMRRCGKDVVWLEMYFSSSAVTSPMCQRLIYTIV